MKMHGNKAKEMIFTKLLQLHGMEVFYATHKHYLVKIKTNKTMRVLSVTKEKSMVH